MTQVTVVTPVFNGMPWLPHAVESVHAQRVDLGDDLEHIIVDGGSTDGSREWLHANSEMGYTCIFERDHGQTDALRKGFARSNGTVLAWLNADDTLEPHALSRVLRVFDEHPDATLVAGACVLVDALGAVISAIPTPSNPSYLGLLLNEAVPPQPATFVTADAYRRVGGVDSRYQLAMDVDLWLRVARVGRVVFLPDQILARFRVHPRAKSVVDLTGTVREDFRIRRRHGMPLRSQAALGLLKRGWLAPWFNTLKRPSRAVVDAVFRR